ncbi:3-methyl-2-oxobutanoate hydroxymethyltransferase [Candidatus Margulisiibacteriota bacterium]
MEKITASKVAKSKVQGRKLSMLTAYDYSLAKILDEAGLDIILVGDSLGNVILGYENTLPVTMADMIHHTKAVSRGVKRALLVADMPVGAMEKAVENAKALVSAGAEAVKVEGVEEIGAITAIIKKGIPVMGHLGFLPQKVKELGGYKVQRSPKIVDEARQLEEAGVFSVVLEMVPEDLAAQVTQAVKIPTIGCGAGPYCDGQVLVSYDMLGLYPNAPKFAKKYVDLRAIISKAVREFMGARSSTG